MPFALFVFLVVSETHATAPPTDDICAPAVERFLKKRGCDPVYVPSTIDNGLAAMHCDGESIFVGMQVEDFMVWRFSHDDKEVNRAFENAWSRNWIEVAGTIDNTVMCSQNGYKWWVGRNTEDRLPKLILWPEKTEGSAK